MMTTGALVDLPFLALVDLGGVAGDPDAAARNGRRSCCSPRRGCCGREAWLLAGAYAIWILPAQRRSERLRTVALAASAPVVWAVTDLA